MVKSIENYMEEVDNEFYKEYPHEKSIGVRTQGYAKTEDDLKVLEEKVGKFLQSYDIRASGDGDVFFVLTSSKKERNEQGNKKDYEYDCIVDVYARNLRFHTRSEIIDKNYSDERAQVTQYSPYAIHFDFLGDTYSAKNISLWEHLEEKGKKRCETEKATC